MQETEAALEGSDMDGCEHFDWEVQTKDAQNVPPVLAWNETEWLEINASTWSPCCGRREPAVAKYRQLIESS